MKKIITFAWGHKIVSFVVIVVIIGGGYFGYQKINTKESANTYATATVEKGMLISSIFGTGQISASNQVEIKPKVSGDLVSVNVKAGQTVKQGDLIVQIDARSAARLVADAKSTLENAELELEELLAPIDKLTLIQAENSLADAEDSLTKLKTTHANNYQNTIETKQKAEDNLEKAYEDAYNTIANAFLDLPDIMTELYAVLFSREISDTEISLGRYTNNSALLNSINDYEDRDDFEDYLDKAEGDYRTAKSAYNDNFDEYKDTSRYSEKDVIEELLEQVLETAKKVADAVKSETNMLDYWVEYRVDKGQRIYSDVAGYQSDLSSYTSKTNSHLSSLLSAQRLIEDYKEAIMDADRDLAEMEQNQPLELAAAERSVAEKEQKLIDLKSGATELEIKSKELSVRQKENNLLEAQDNYADHFIRVPFDGQIAEVNAAKGDNVSSNDNLCALITEQKIAEVTLNEIDVAQVQTGQKANLAFDAVEDLSITGKVVEVDTLGVNDQGVVSYGIKIAFDVQDEKIKSGMSVTANIITESKQNVISVPNSAVKSQQGAYYVQVMENLEGKLAASYGAGNILRSQQVEVGISNDTMTEIVSGLKEGDLVVTGTISQADEAQPDQNQGFQLPGTTGGGGMKIK